MRLALATLIALSQFGCAALIGGGIPSGKEAGNYIEDTCIVGKLAAEGSLLLNAGEGDTLVDWHGEYVRHYGKTGEHDRIISSSCAAGLKRLLSEEWRDKSEL